MAKISVLGAGSWGTAVALHLARNQHQVTLWGHNEEHLNNLATQRENKKYLPGFPFPQTLSVSPDLRNCLNHQATVIIAVPSHGFNDLFCQITHIAPKLNQGLCWISKGINPLTNTFLSEAVIQRWGSNYPHAILSGPSFAKEVAANLPTAVTIATNDKAYGLTLQNLFHDEHFRVYLSDDTKGVQLCGAVKNVIAIATGISDGLKYGANARAALITRGLAEMSRLGAKFGANPETFSGLAGLGDLVLTCTDDQSRNRRYGLSLGQGINSDEAEQKIGQVVEGKHNASQVCELAREHQIEMPICQSVQQILNQQISAQQAVHQLMMRPLKNERS